MSLSLFAKNPILQTLENLDLATKNLAFQLVQKGSNKRKLVVSSQLLNLLGWFKGERLQENVIGKGLGLKITRAVIGQTGTKKVYERTYAKTKRLEPLLDIRNQTKIDEAFLFASRAHIEITRHSITITPIFDCSSWNTKGAIIKVPSIHDFTDVIISIISTLKREKITHADLEADVMFWDSEDALLLTTQLRRAGYQLSKETNNLLRISNNNNMPASMASLSLLEPMLPQGPPATPNTKPSTFVAFSAGIRRQLTCPVRDN